MYIKEFNREYSILANGKTVLGQEDEMQLHCLLTVSILVIRKGKWLNKNNFIFCVFNYRKLYLHWVMTI